MLSSAGSSVSVSYPLQGQLISGPELDAWLREGLAACRERVWLCSAYIRTAAFERLWSSRPLEEQLNASVLVRWQVQDLLSGASDLNLFCFCRSRGIELFLKLDFHGKVYAVPPAGIGVGSTNATASGLGFAGRPNAEMNTLVMCTDVNLRTVQSQFYGATRVTEQLYRRMELELAALQKSKLFDPQWSSDISSLLEPLEPPTSLLVDECFITDGLWWAKGVDAREASGAEHDLQLLGLAGGARIDGVLQSALRRTKCVRWLISLLQRAPAGELYFGALTAALHSALLDDPGPRRSEVKTLLQNLLSWIQIARLPELSVDRPNHSQRVRLLSREV
jgi:hypothetical protein